jgi:hypothetical protein
MDRWHGKILALIVAIERHRWISVVFVVWAFFCLDRQLGQCYNRLSLYFHAPVSLFSSTNEIHLLKSAYGLVHQFYRRNHAVDNRFIPATALTASWDPHKALWTVNLTNYLLNCSITLYTRLSSPWIRVMYSALYQIKITPSHSPCRKLSNGIKFVNFHCHLSFVPISVKFCREYLKIDKMNLQSKRRRSFCLCGAHCQRRRGEG